MGPTVVTPARPAATDAPVPGRRRRSGRVRAASATGTGVFHLLSATAALLFLAPLVHTALNSLKTPEEASAQPPTWFPRSLSLANYGRLTTFGEGIGTYLVNSLVLSALSVLFTVVASVLAGYGFARFTFRGRGLLFGTTLLILMVPYASLLLPLYIVLGWLGLQNTVVGVALVLTMFQLPFGVFLMRNSFESVPREIEEAALVDGATSLRALRYVSLPLVAPGVATVALFSFIASWNEFLAPLIFLTGGDRYTLPIMLTFLRSGAYGAVDYGALQAGVVLAVLPTLVVYLLLQRYYVAGLTGGALRG
ncbi:MAG: ABC transporter, permease protein 2 (cluster 1, maltose/g3p/polyamine/iron) [uncultured Quadrisphaera sp.]|uniref:ABC transporter, permease protein 2 (Cluster 1, maltose/g3p/polyamine/iron) n=1 Tax=uncultured Quadrisphaera sp. TaxID=904978 RepID=A0A6J4NSP6_9ACTN|nr:MAG: ABC transporter, permease protein 2 (cluster 1, maltose/g3p/polyamine/iron) [uncultured Quadrisphaera sp.]